MPSSPVYQIRVAGLLDHSWSDWLDGLSIQHTANNDTLLTGPLLDQAALHGVLNKIRDLGLTLMSVSMQPATSAGQAEA